MVLLWLFWSRLFCGEWWAFCIIEHDKWTCFLLNISNYLLIHSVDPPPLPQHRVQGIPSCSGLWSGRQGDLLDFQVPPVPSRIYSFSRLPATLYNLSFLHMEIFRLSLLVGLPLQGRAKCTILLLKPWSYISKWKQRVSLRNEDIFLWTKSGSKFLLAQHTHMCVRVQTHTLSACNLKCQCKWQPSFTKINLNCSNN